MDNHPSSVVDPLGLIGVDFLGAEPGKYQPFGPIAAGAYIGPGREKEARLAIEHGLQEAMRLEIKASMDAHKDAVGETEESAGAAAASTNTLSSDGSETTAATDGTTEGGQNEAPTQDKEIFMFELKNWSSNLTGIEQEGEMDCFYTSMAMIDAYYGNNRTPQYFKDLNGGEEGAQPEDFKCIITAAGYNFEKAKSFSSVGKAMNAGNPSIVGEISSGNIWTYNSSYFYTRIW